MKKEASMGGVLLGLGLLSAGIFLVHYGIDSEICKEKNEQGLAIGASILCFILGNRILSKEMGSL